MNIIRESVIVKLATTFVILVSILILLAFRIENWGGEPDLHDQNMMKLVGLAFLIPIIIPYLFCGWVFSRPQYGNWSYNIIFPAMALYLWNANYAWQNPVHPISLWHEIFYSLVKGVPFLPILVMVWVKLRSGTNLHNL